MKLSRSTTCTQWLLRIHTTIIGGATHGKYLCWYRKYFQHSRAICHSVVFPSIYPLNHAIHTHSDISIVSCQGRSSHWSRYTTTRVSLNISNINLATRESEKIICQLSYLTRDPTWDLINITKHSHLSYTLHRPLKQVKLFLINCLQSSCFSCSFYLHIFDWVYSTK